MGSSHLVRAMSNINFNQFIYDYGDIYRLVENSHSLYIVYHPILFLISIHTVTLLDVLGWTPLSQRRLSLFCFTKLLMVWHKCPSKASLSRRIRVLEEHNMKFLDRLAIQLASMDSRFSLKLLVHGTGFHVCVYCSILLSGISWFLFLFFHFSHGILLSFHIPPYHLSNPLQPLSFFSI